MDTNTTTLPRAEHAEWPTFSTTFKVKGVTESSDWQLEEAATVAAVAQVTEVATSAKAAAAKATLRCAGGGFSPRP